MGSCVRTEAQCLEFVAQGLELVHKAESEGGGVFLKKD